MSSHPTSPLIQSWQLLTQIAIQGSAKISSPSFCLTILDQLCTKSKKAVKEVNVSVLFYDRFRFDCGSHANCADENNSRKFGD